MRGGVVESPPMTKKVEITPCWIGLISINDLIWRIDFISYYSFFHFRSHCLSKNVCHYSPGDMGGRGSTRLVTNDDKGRKGVTNYQFFGDVIFEWPLNEKILTSCSNYKKKLNIVHLLKKSCCVFFTLPPVLFFF